MSGVLRIAYKLLVNDRGKFAALLIGITFAVLLMVMMTSMFAGVMSRASATVLNTGSSVWVMDRSVNTVANADLRLIPVAIVAVSSHGNFITGELTNEEAIHRRTDHRDPARG